MALEILSLASGASDINEACRALDEDFRAPAACALLPILGSYFGQDQRRFDAVALQQDMIDLQKHCCRFHEPRFFRNETLTGTPASGKLGSMIDAM